MLERLRAPAVKECLLLIYFFHVENGTIVPDSEGTELPSDEAAKSEAIAASAEMLSGLGRRFWEGTGWKMQVVDETGREILVLECRGEMREPAAKA